MKYFNQQRNLFDFICCFDILFNSKSNVKYKKFSVKYFQVCHCQTLVILVLIETMESNFVLSILVLNDTSYFPDDSLEGRGKCGVLRHK